MTPGKPFTQLVYDGLSKDIVNGTLTTNDILSESSLCERFGVSKSPVREALVMLCNENILQSIPRTGYKLVHIQPHVVEELLELRESLEMYMFEKAIHLLDEEDITKLELIQVEIESEEKAMDTAQDHWKRNERFHLALAGMANNTLMLKQLQQALNMFARVSTQYFLGRRRELPHQDLHVPLIEALKSKDTFLALKILKQDIREII